MHPLQAQTETVLHSFAGPINGGSGADGAAPLAGLVRDSSGNFYGTTDNGGSGTFGVGTVFELINSSGSYTEKVLYSFAGPIDGGSGADGALPNAGLVIDSSGNLYGTTYAGGPSGVGTVFELVNSSGNYTEKLLYSFAGINAGDGASPLAGLVTDSSGDLYGTTFNGGSGSGTVFELVNSSGTYTEKVLYRFAGLSGGDGSGPNGGLVMDSSGNLYGTTVGGGASLDAGTVFELVNSSGSYTERLLYSFTDTGGDGSNPYAGLVMDSSGDLYGTTFYGGSSSSGTVFELLNSSGTYTEKVLYSFAGVDAGDGQFPFASLVMDGSGNLYGTTTQGGALSNLGTVFELANSSGSYTERLLHSFAGLTKGDGSDPVADLVMDPSGNLYGTTETGGASGGYGTVFEVAFAPAPAATLSATSLNFGNVPVGTPSGAMSVTVMNTGSANLIFAGGAVTVSGTNYRDFVITSDTCSGQTIAPNNTCSVSVTFTPSFNGGETASLNFPDNAPAPGSTQMVSLSGTGVAPPFANFSPSNSSYNLGNVTEGQSATQTITLSNTGNGPLMLNGVSFGLSTSPGFSFTDSCTVPVTLSPGSSCTITVQFAPTTTLGLVNVSLVFADNAGPGQSNLASTTGNPYYQVVSFSGTGVAPPFASFSPTQLNFGNVAQNTAATKTVAVQNTGSELLTLDLVYLGVLPPPGFSYTQVVCNGVTEPVPLPSPFTISPTETCTFTVQFDPTTTGAFSGGLAFADNAAPGESNLTSTVINSSTFGQVVPLSGTGVTVPPPMQAANLNFSETATSAVSPGGTITYMLAVTNTGPNTATTVVVNDPLPSAVSSPSGNCNSTNQLSISVSTQTGITTASCAFTQIAVNSTATMTINTTVSSTATAGQTLTNTATVSEDETNNDPVTATATTTVSTSGGGGGASPCGCSTTGAYVNPSQGTSPAATSSANYTATTNPSSPAGNPFTLIIKSPGGTTVFNQSLAAGATWGFSPDGARLEVDSVSGSEETVSVYNLTSTPVPVSNPLFSILENASSSQIVFSRSGQYLAYMGLTGSSSSRLLIYNVLTGQKVYEDDFSFQTVAGQGQNQYGAVGDWGFSPDKPETTFVYAYLNGQTSAQWELVHLTQNPLSGTTGEATSLPLTWATSDFWQFSPCGDAIGIVTQSGSDVGIQLLRTEDGQQVYGMAGFPISTYTLSTNSTDTEQIATDSNGNVTQLAANSTWDLGCSAQNTPEGTTTVQPVDSSTGTAPVTLTFNDVTSPGQTTLTTSSTGPAAPSSYEIDDGPNSQPVYFDLTTTASYSGNITVCINYSALNVTNPQALTLIHYVNGQTPGVQIYPGTPGTLDTATSQICGVVTSLSPFAVGESLIGPTASYMSLAPGVISTLQSSTATGSILSAVAFDAQGNEYVLDSGLGTVTEYPAGGGQPTVVVASGILSNPSDMAFGPNGTLYISDQGNHRIVAVTFSRSLQVTPLTIRGTGAPSLIMPTGIAAGGPLGDLFVSDPEKGSVFEFNTTTAGSLTYVGTVINAGSSGLMEPLGLAVDAAGDVFVANSPTSNSQPGNILEVTARTQEPATSPMVISSQNIQAPYGLALDAAGDLYYTDAALFVAGRVDTMGNIITVAGNGSSTDSGDGGLATQAGIASPLGIALDSSNRIYIADSSVMSASGGLIRLVDVTTSAMNFSIEADGTSSSLQAVLLTNTNSASVGASNLSISGADAPDFAISTNTCADSLASGASCSLAITFTPAGGASGPRNASLTFQVGTNTQTIQLNATSLGGSNAITPTVNWSAPAAITYGSALSETQLNATVTPNIPGTFTFTPPLATVLNADTGGQTQALSVIFTPTDTTDYATANASVQITVNQAALTVSANNVSRVYGAANPTFAGSITGAVNGDTFTETFSTTAAVTSSVGTYPITPGICQCANAANYNVTFVNGTLTITQAGTSVQLSTSANGPVTDGTPVVLTAKAVPSTSGTPTGTVTFLNGSTNLGQGTLSQAVATLTTSTLPSGSNNITAQYSGDTDFTSSTSPVETVSVNSPDYTVSANPSTLTVAAGQSASTTITVTPEGYSGTVSFSCGTLPSYITCAFNPSSSVTFASGATAAQTITLTVSVASTISRLELQKPFLLAMAVPLGLLGLLPIASGPRKRLKFYLAIVLLAVTVAGVVVGCSSSGASSPTSNLPPAGNQSFTVTASGSSPSGTISHQLQLTITVTN